MYDYNESIKRNWGFVSSDTQSKIRQASILLAGCGLTSNVAKLAVQQGFRNFILVDGDVVEVSNLNRQSFYYSQVGMPKVEALRQVILDTAPDASVVTFHEFITPESVKRFVSMADVIVNTVDFDHTRYDIDEISRIQGKPVFFPMNLGFAGFCIISTPDSVTVEEIFGERIVDNFPLFLDTLIQRVEGIIIPEYLQVVHGQLYRIMIEAETKGVPQLGVAAYRSSSVVVESIIRYLANDTLIVAPNAILLDTEGW
jgi:molybdopterin/thiamine biosynthesis adenylyltransferase